MPPMQTNISRQNQRKKTRRKQTWQIPHRNRNIQTLRKGETMKIKNENYRQFLDEGIIDLVTESQIMQALKNITGRYTREGRALLIALYYTGARPNEILRLKGKDFGRDKSYMTVKVKGSKKGLARTLYFPYKLPLIKELYHYARSLFEEQFIFYHYKSSYIRTVKHKDGTTSQREDTTDKLRYHLQKWFKGVIEGSITPYFLRHNRFSQLSQAGADREEIRMLKGSRSTESVSYYIHMSSKSAKDVAKRIK